MTLLLTNSDWQKYRENLPAKYNLFDAKINGTPESFPCMVRSVLLNDVNGISIRNFMVYISDARTLLESTFGVTLSEKFTNRRLSEDINE